MSEMREINRKLDVIPAQAGTQVTSPQGLGQLDSPPFLRGLVLRNIPHSSGPVTWAPACAGVTPGWLVALQSRHP
jgi:hypothetical protein